MKPTAIDIPDGRAHLNVTEFPARRAEASVAEWRAFAQAATPEAFCEAWLALQCSMVPGATRAAVVLRDPGAERFVPVAFWPADAADRAALAQVVERALAEGAGVVMRTPGAGGEPGTCAIAYPVLVDDAPRGAVALELADRADALLQAALRQLQWGAGWLEVLLRRHAEPDEGARRRLTLALHVLATFLEQPDAAAATTALATELAARLGCERVYVGLLRDGRPQVAALSHTAHFDQRANIVRAAEGAMAEAIDQRATVVYPQPAGPTPLVARSHADLAAQTGAGAVVSLPLARDGRAVGALVLETAAGQEADEELLGILRSVSRLAGPLVALQEDAGLGAIARAKRTAAAGAERLVGPGHPVAKLAAAGAVVLALFLGLATGTHRVTATTVIEGEVQRAVTAPFGGYLRETLVRPGDRVRKGTPLVRLDDRDLRLEQARSAAERSQLERQYREAMAAGDRAQVVVLAAQVEQAEARRALVEEQLARTEIAAPFDGVVLSGDLTQVLGAPVERGQLLMELAPLDAYRVVLQVDERDVNRVQPGERGTLALSALPGERIGFTVVKLTPVNVAREGRNYFRVEAKLDRPVGALRPGMEGVGKIEVGSRNLAWIWLHPLLDWMRMTVWTWAP